MSSDNDPSRPPTSPGIRRLRLVLIILVMLPVLDVARYAVYPPVSKLAVENPDTTAMMRLRQRQAVAKGRKAAVRQSWVPLSRISPNVTKAVLIAEDDKFWSHGGFDIEGIEKAIEKDIKKRRFRAGGSTISQQLAKNLYLSPSRNPVRKLKEAILTWRIERALKKRRILELYLNVAEWGDGVFGIEAAARHYYGVSASALGPREAARLAAVLPSPLRYSPVNPSRYVDNRSRAIYRIMLRRGIAIEEFDEVMKSGQETEESAPGEGRESDGFENATGAVHAPAFSGATTAVP